MKIESYLILDRGDLLPSSSGIKGHLLNLNDFKLDLKLIYSISMIMFIDNGDTYFLKSKYANNGCIVKSSNFSETPPEKTTEVPDQDVTNVTITPDAAKKLGLI